MWMYISWGVTLVLLIALGVLLGRGRASSRRSVGFPYARRQHLLGVHGRHFLQVLDRIIGPDVRVFAQVRMTDVMRVTHRPGSGRFDAALARIVPRRFDFVLCDRESLAVLCAVTLDEMQRRDPGGGEFAQSFAARMCRVAGLPLVRVIAQRDYDLKDLSNRLLQAMQRGRARESAADTSVTMAHRMDVSTQPPAGNEALTAPAGKSDPETRRSVLTPALMASLTHSARTQDRAPTCPRCGAAMLRRRVHVGTHPGGDFWGCSRFPICRAVTPIAEPGARTG